MQLHTHFILKNGDQLKFIQLHWIISEEHIKIRNPPKFQSHRLKGCEIRKVFEILVDHKTRNLREK